MQIGEIIRKYRKEKNLTQEEMASRLGVTASAVNKWEKGNSLPDITLLAPIARLLGVSLDTLLSYQAELTKEEISRLVIELDNKCKSQPYEDVFQWAKGQIELYPNSEWLILQMAIILDAQRLTKKVESEEKYEAFIHDCYVRVLNSEDETLRTKAADSLYGYYTRQGDYAKAEEYLAYFSEQNPERKRKQAYLYSQTNQVEEAYRTYEELLFSGYQMLSMVFNGMYQLAMQDGELSRAHMLVAKQRELAHLFEMGAYHEASCGLDLATVEQDVDTILEIMDRMLASIEEINEFRDSMLYEHMQFKDTRPEFVAELKANLLKCFQDEEAYGFLKEDKRWQELVKGNEGNQENSMDK